MADNTVPNRASNMEKAEGNRERALDRLAAGQVTMELERTA